MTFEWTKERTQQLLEWRDQGITREEIAKLFGVGYGAVVGKLNRLKDQKVKLPNGMTIQNAARLERQKARVAELMAQGMPGALAAVEAGMGKKRALELFRTPLKPKPLVGTGTRAYCTDEEIIEKVKSGKTVNTICFELPVSDRRVIKLIEKHNLTRPVYVPKPKKPPVLKKPKRQTEERDAAVIAALRAGKPITGIAKELHVCVETIRRLRGVHGIPKAVNPGNPAALRRAVVKKERPKPPPVRLVAALSAEEMARLAARKTTACQWPTGNRPYRFECAETPVPGLPYCAGCIAQHGPYKASAAA